MVQDRKEPTLSGIAPDRDEILTHQNRMGNTRRPSGNRPGAARPAPPAKKSAIGVFALFVAVIATAGAGVAGWQLLETQKALTDATGRISELEARLNLTNDESSQSVTAIHEKLEWADSEIRKLWGVSYDTNRKAIATNKDNITAAAANANQAAGDAKAAKTLADKHEGQVSVLQSQSNEQQIQVSRAIEDLNIQEQQLKQLSDLAAQVDTLSKNLEKRVNDSEEAIEAINAFRRSANSDIQQLKQQVSNQGPG